MDLPTASPRDPKVFSTEARPTGSATTRTDFHNILIINSQPGYPCPVAIARYFRDASSAVDVKQLIRVVLGCETDALLHYGQQGTSLVLRKTAQTQLWGPKTHGTAQLTDLIQPLNIWLRERAAILKGKRAVANRIAQSDAALDEFGYTDLRRTLLGLAGRKPKTRQIVDAAGHGGVLEIPPRAHLLPVDKTEEPAPTDGGAKILRIEPVTQVIDPAGILVETPTARVSIGVVEGGRALAHHPHKAAVRSRWAQHANVVEEDKRQNDENE